MRKIITMLACLGALASLVLATPAAAAGPKPASNLSGSIWGTAPVTSVTADPSAAAVGCPVGDGSATWGKGKVCPGPDAGSTRFHIQDSLTDGYCVRIKWYSEDRGLWVEDGQSACTTGQWITFVLQGRSKFCTPSARLYRGNGSYFTMPTTIC